MMKMLGDAKAIFQNGPEPPWLGVHFVNLREAYVVGPFDSIMKTEDGRRGSVVGTLDGTHR